MRNRLNQTAMLLACGGVTIAFVGCEISPEPQELLGASSDASAGVVSVIPNTASPGTTVRVEAAGPVFMKDGYASVRIGEQVAQVVREISDVAVEVLVPNAAPGATRVQIIEPDQPPGPPGSLSILPSRSLQLVVSLSDERLELLDSRPGGAHPRRGIDPGGRRVQYEVFNALGRLVFRDVLTHPTLGRFEIFDAPDSGEHTMHRLDERESAKFAIMIPNVPGGATVRFYDVPDGVVADSPEGRRRREFLSELNVDGQTGPKD